MIRRRTTVLTFVAAATLSARLVHSADHEAVLSPFMTDDVVAVAYVDITSIDALGMLDWADSLGLVTADERAELNRAGLELQQQLDELTDFGVRHVYHLFRVADVQHGGPTWVVPVANAASAKTALNLIISGRPDSADPREGGRPGWLPTVWRSMSGALVGGYAAEQVQRQSAAESEARSETGEAWQALGDGNCGLLLVWADHDSRRVIRDMLPRLPAPFSAITGQLLADGGRWGGVSLQLPPEPAAQIVMAWADEQSASIVAQAVADGLELLAESQLAKKHLADADRLAIADALQPRVDGTRVFIAPSEFTGNADRLAKMLSPPIRKARQAPQRRQRMNQFKQFALAFLNHADRHKMFPKQAIYDQHDRPLLSWRVLLLPELEQGHLFQQFRLDEPWDSPHNRQFIEQMPAIYADADPALRQLAAAGKTTFVAPTGFGTLFAGNVDKTSKDVLDGLSNTILFVEVPPAGAVVWTKPVDWEVDFAHPWHGLRRNDRDFFSCVFVDGSAHTLGHSLTGEDLSGLLTPAGGEIVDLP